MAGSTALSSSSFRVLSNVVQHNTLSHILCIIVRYASIKIWYVSLICFQKDIVFHLGKLVGSISSFFFNLLLLCLLQRSCSFLCIRCHGDSKMFHSWAGAVQSMPLLISYLKSIIRVSQCIILRCFHSTCSEIYASCAASATDKPLSEEFHFIDLLCYWALPCRGNGTASRCIGPAKPGRRWIRYVRGSRPPAPPLQHRALARVLCPEREEAGRSSVLTDLRGV